MHVVIYTSKPDHEIELINEMKSNDFFLIKSALISINLK